MRRRYIFSIAATSRSAASATHVSHLARPTAESVDVATPANSARMFSEHLDNERGELRADDQFDL